MAQPVWVLSVDLQTKTATFQSGMADAAKSARGAFTEIQSGSNKMGESVGYSMGEARHGVMMLGEEFGVHLPRGLTTFIASLGPVGAAMEAAFPFLAIALGATLLIEHLVKMHEEGEKLTEDQVKFGTAVQNAFNTLDNKILSAQLHADELRNDHLGALHKQLEMIDKQSMAELVHSFEEVSKAADVVMGDIQSHWYTFGIGSEGAKHALTGFKNEYDSLLAQGKQSEAADLLKGTRESAEKVLAMQKQGKAALAGMGGKAGTDTEDQTKYDQARNELKKAGVGWTEKEIQAQEALVEALKAQSGIEEKIATLKKLESDNATATTKKTMGEEAARKAKENAEAEKRASEEAKRFYEDAYRQYVQVIDQGERETIAATKEGSAARLAAIDSAIQEEKTEQLTGTAYYRELLTSRVNLVRQMAEEEAKVQAAAAKEAADNTEKMGALALAAEREQQQLADSARRMTAQQRVQEELNSAKEEYDIKVTNLSQQIAALDKGEKDYENKLQQLQDKQKQLVQQHENDITAIKDKAEIERNQKILSAEQHFQDEIASGLTQVLMGHKTFASMMDSIGNQVVSGMMQNAIKAIMANDMSKSSDAAKAARSAYLIGQSMGGPAGIVLGPVFATAAFAAVSAFADGTDGVPGYGKGDHVPAMLEPGEGVVPGGVMDGLRNMARSGNMGGAKHYHVSHSPTYHVQTIDGDGIKGVLDKHSQEFSKHVTNQLRKINR